MTETLTSLARAAGSTRTSSRLAVSDRAAHWKRLTTEDWDILVIGGGITGAAVLRDATSRGLKACLVERADYAHGTSSRSSKLVHGGLRYLENLEFGLVFEALSERSFLLKSAPHLVHPLPFYFPVYRGDLHGKNLLRMGMWLYDLLSLFRTPGMHQNFSARRLAREIPELKAEGSRGGFKYYDASMWDDVLVTETLRPALTDGAISLNYCEAVSLSRDADDLARGALVKDLLTGAQAQIRARQVIACVGPWADQFGKMLDPAWRPWLKPSQGIHLVFDLKRLSLPGAVVMAHPKDGRISFAIPRPDFGAGVTIVGTTDGDTPLDPEEAVGSESEFKYLFALLNDFFPRLKLTEADLVSSYVGVRPLVGPADPAGNGTPALAKVSREHEIRLAPGGVVMIAGGKYTTHRVMAHQMVDFAVHHAPPGGYSRVPGPSNTRGALNPAVTLEKIESLRRAATVPEKLLSRFGDEAERVLSLDAGARRERGYATPDPDGFPALAGQLLFALQEEGIVTLRDFYFRRAPLYLSRKDHGMPWAEPLAKLWAQVRALDPSEILLEVASLEKEIKDRKVRLNR